MSAIDRLITLPPAAARYAQSAGSGFLPGWHAACDPDGSKLGSGGGAVHALLSAWRAARVDAGFEEWLRASQKLIVHGGGESRRLPAYSVLGKPLIAVPPEIGENESFRTLLDLQTRSCERMLARAPWARVMVASGDVLFQFDDSLSTLPEADILIFGAAIDPESARQFGVLFVDPADPQRLRSFAQKPSREELQTRSTATRFLVDTGAWLLGARAVDLLLAKSGCDRNVTIDESVNPFELYAGLGPALGSHPIQADPAANLLSVAVVELTGGKFLHFGSTRQLCEASARVVDSKGGNGRISGPEILNSEVSNPLLTTSGPIWISDSVISQSWNLSGGHVFTGLPENTWALSPPAGACIDMTPIEGDGYCVRAYGLDDEFRGRMDCETTLWFGRPATNWFTARGIQPAEAGILAESDIFDAPIFPVISPKVESSRIQWLLDSCPRQGAEFAEWWMRSRRLSARDIAGLADIGRIQQNRKYLGRGRPSSDFAELMCEIRAQMQRAEHVRSQGDDRSAEVDEEAFRILREAIVDSALAVPPNPRRNVLEDQIVWSRCPVRLDLAGGWTDTPPYCILNGGSVLNVAVELNGQPPIQVFAKRSRQPEIVIRSIDLGTEQRITSFEQLGDYANPRSGFSLARAALAIAGLHPRFAESDDGGTLSRRLEPLGGGVEVSLVAAVPQGSGLGASSILAVTLLAALSEMYGLEWSHQDLIARTLAVEQLVTTGGGWQDQAGGLIPGIKLLESASGPSQDLRSERLPESLFADGTADGSILLFYTGLTRLAKGILQEVVRGMFVNEPRRSSTLKDIAANAKSCAESIRMGDRGLLCATVRESWRLNQKLDEGTNPPEVQAILDPIQDYVDAAKLLGAGGGGYLLVFAKDKEAGGRIRREFSERPPNARARLVNFRVSQTGLETTRS